MTKQRQLSDQGRQVARDIGGAMKALRISIGQIYSSQLNWAIDTGSLISGAPLTTVSELTDSGAGSAAAMANPNGANTSRTADAFGKEFADVKEAETLIYRPNPVGTPTLVGRVQAGEWIGHASSPRS